MRLNGKKIEGPMVETVVIPRQSEDLVFKCKAVLDYETFDKLVPEPQPPTITLRNKKPTPDLNDVEYIKAVADRNLKRFQYMILNSILATENLEFETVDVNKPDTWINMEKELKDSGLTPSEIGTLYQGAADANGMNEEKLKEARARFFDTQNQNVNN